MNYYIIFLLAIFSDQLSKFFVERNLLPGENIPILEGYLEITYVRNTGAAFGIFSERRIFLLIIQSLVLILLYILYKFYLPADDFSKFFLVLIIAGALGNIIDRVRLGYVIDFIDIQIWPIFNFADIFIVVGTLGIVYNLWNRL